MTETPGTSLEDSAHWAGRHRWSELALFAALGGWVASVGQVEVKLLLDRHSQQAAWRAQQWWDRLPVLAEVDRDALCAAPSEQASKIQERLVSLADPVARLAGAYRVAFPRLWAAYECHRFEAGRVADGSTLRTLGIVAADLAADWREGEVALQGLLHGDPRGVATAAATVAELEREILAEGPEQRRSPGPPVG